MRAAACSRASSRIWRSSRARSIVTGRSPAESTATICARTLVSSLIAPSWARIGISHVEALIRAFEQRMDTLVTHPLFGYRINYRQVLEVQTRLLARFVTGDGALATASTRGASSHATFALSTSSGSASTTGPGRPEIARRHSRATYSGMRSGRSIGAAHFATGPNIWR